MSFMFDGCNNLTSLNVSSFNTKKPEATEAMFRNCTSLKILDLRIFTTDTLGRGGSISEMFANATALQRVIVDDSWAINFALAMPGTDGIFAGCTSIISGNGTTYDASKVSSKYAHIDGATLLFFGAQPGYFTSETQAKALGLL